MMLIEEMNLNHCDKLHPNTAPHQINLKSAVILNSKKSHSEFPPEQRAQSARRRQSGSGNRHRHKAWAHLTPIPARSAYRGRSQARRATWTGTPAVRGSRSLP